MTRITQAVVAFLIVLFLGEAAHAEAGEGNRVVAGLKTWTNSWTRQLPGAEKMNSNHVMLIGWEAEILFSNRMFLEASYLLSYPEYVFNQPAPASQRDRDDLDVALGYQFNRAIGCFLGVRSTRMVERGTQYKETLSGPLVGLRGAASLTEALSLFGRFTYLPMNTRKVRAAVTEHEDATGWFAAAGISYDFFGKFTGSLGYQYEATKGDTTGIKDTFAGVTVDVIYRY